MRGILLSGENQAGGEMEFREQLLEWMQGEEIAVSYLAHVIDSLHLLDDLVDGDRDIDPRDAVMTFYAQLCLVPGNTFYQRYQAMLNSTLAVAVANWMAANSIEAEPGVGLEALQVAFVIRSTYADLITLCAVLIGGVEHGAKVAREVRLSCAQEGFDKYRDALSNEHRR